VCVCVFSLKLAHSFIYSLITHHSSHITHPSLTLLLTHHSLISTHPISSYSEKGIHVRGGGGKKLTDYILPIAPFVDPYSHKKDSELGFNPFNPYSKASPRQKPPGLMSTETGPIEAHPPGTPSDHSIPLVPQHQTQMRFRSISETAAPKPAPVKEMPSFLMPVPPQDPWTHEENPITDYTATKSQPDPTKSKNVLLPTSIFKFGPIVPGANTGKPEDTLIPVMSPIKK
jgi:hypothetical protein